MLITIMLSFHWDDLKQFLTDKYFDLFYPILSQKAFLLSLCHRDLYLSKLDDLPDLSIPMQIYIHSHIIRKLTDQSLSKFACKCGPISNPILSKIISFEELIQIFVIEQCKKPAQSLNGELIPSNAMLNAFINSKSVRIGITKTILSHPLCVLWEYRETLTTQNEFYLIQSRSEILTLSSCFSTPYDYLIEKGINELVDDLDYLWYFSGGYTDYYDNDICLIFVDNVNGTQKCGIFAVEIEYSAHHDNDEILYENLLIFDENTSLDEFKKLYCKSLANLDYFNFTHCFWSKYQIQEYLLSPFPNSKKKWTLKGFINCLEYFYPLLYGGNTQNVEESKWLQKEFIKDDECQKVLFMKYQAIIQKYTKQITNYINDRGIAIDRDKLLEILDGMRYRMNGNGMVTKKSKVIKHAVERCFMRIINSILWPYLKHCHFYLENAEILKLVKRGELEQVIENNEIGINNGMPTYWPELFLMMSIKWMPFICQCMMYDLASIDEQKKETFNLVTFSKTIKSVGLKVIVNDKSIYICDYLQLIIS